VLLLVGFDFCVLVGWVPLILVFGGFVAVSKLLEKLTKGSAETVLKAIGFFGFFVGVFLLITGIVVLLTQTWDVVSWGLLIVTGLGLALKPLSRIPFAALFGLVVGAVCAGLLYWFFPLPATVLGISSIWIYLAVFLIPALLVFLLFKFAEDVMKLFALVLGAWPVVTALGVLCILQGVMLLLLNQSLLSLFG